MAPGYLSVTNKYYLSGFDWVMNVLDLILRRTTCAGNASQIVLSLDRPIDAGALREQLERFLGLFPAVSGRVSRHWTLTPYWRMPDREARPRLLFNEVRSAGAREEVPALLAAAVNTPFPGETDHLAFHLVRDGDGHCLAMTFDHRLFDARGAESFVGLFQQFLAGDGSVAERVNLVRSFDLTDWKRKFLSGRTVNRKVIAMSKAPLRSVPIDTAGGSSRGFRFRVLTFDQDETRAITERAYEQAGYLMVMPYLFSAAVLGMHRIFEKRGLPPGSHVIPVTRDMRRSKDVREELFFNQNSMFFFQLLTQGLEDRPALIRRIREQMYEQVQGRFAEQLAEASALMRIAPLSLLRRVFHLPLKGKIASYSFSHVNKSANLSRRFMDAEVVNVYHMPRTPVPPGIGIYFSTFDNRLNATLSWLDGLFTDDEMEALERDLRGSL